MRFYKLGVLSSLLAVLFMLFSPCIALASDITDAEYAGTVRVHNNSTVSSNVYTTFVLNTTNLIDGNYVYSNCTNTAIRSNAGADVAYMPATGATADDWCVYVPTISQNGILDYKLYTGGTTDMAGKLRYFPDATGMTVPDTLSLGAGDDFEFELKGYVDTDAGSSKDLVYKQYAFKTYISGATNITASILTTANQSPYSSADDGKVYGQNAVYATARTAAAGTAATTATSTIGQDTGFIVYRSYFYFDTSVIPDDAPLQSATLKLYGKTDTSTTDFDIVVQTGAAGYPHTPLVVGDYDYTKYSGDGGSINTSTFTEAGYNNITLNATGLSWINRAGMTNFCIRSSRDIAGTQPAGAEYIDVYTSEAGGTANDPQLVVTYESPSLSVTATGVTPAEHTVTVGADTVNLYISIDGGAATTTALGGASVPVNANTWTFCESAAMPYVESVSVDVGGAPVSAWAWENNATTFSDSVGTNDATPSFRSTSSDSDVWAELVGFAPIAQAQADADVVIAAGTMITGAPDTVPQMYTELNTTALPFEWIDDTLAGASVPKALFWFLVPALIICLLGLVITEKTKMLLAQVIIMGCAIVALSVMGLWPWWVIIPFSMCSAAVVVGSKAYGW